MLGLRGPAHLVLGLDDEASLAQRSKDEVNLLLGHDNNVDLVPRPEDEVDIDLIKDDKVNHILGSVEKADFILGHKDYVVSSCLLVLSVLPDNSRSGEHRSR